MGRPVHPLVSRLILSALALALTLAACATPTPPPEPITIRLAAPAADQDQIKKLAEQFAKTHPGVTVEVLARRWDTITGLDVSGADVVLTTQFALDEMRSRGLLLSLDPLIAGDKGLNQADFLPGAARMFVDAGKTWALPAGLDVQVLYFNKELFDRRGVAYPNERWTRADFEQAARKLSDPDSASFGYAVITDFLDPILFIYQHGGRLVDDLEAPTRTTFTDPKTIEAVDWYARLLREPGIVLTAQNAGTVGAGNVQYTVRSGKVGMWIAALSARGGRFDRAAWPMKWGMAPLPSDARTATMATAAGYAITTQCKRSLTCWQFIAFLSQQPIATFAPARRSLIKAMSGQDAEVARIAQAAADNALMLRGGDINKLEKAIEVFMAALEQVIADKASAAEAMAAAQLNSPMP